MRYHLPQGYRRWLLGLAMLALLCIAAAVAAFFLPAQSQQPQAQYLLKDNAGRLALYTPVWHCSRALPFTPKPNCSKNWKITACSLLLPCLRLCCRAFYGTLFYK